MRSFNNEIGLPLTVLRADESTRFLVLEMGASGPGHLTYLTDIAPPDVAVVLVVGHAHLGGFGGIDAVAVAKAEIVQGLVPDGVAVLNADDPRVSAMAVAGARRRRARSAPRRQATSAPRDVRLDRAGRARFTLVTRGDDRDRARSSCGSSASTTCTTRCAAAAAALAVGLDARRGRRGADAPPTRSARTACTSSTAPTA